MTIEEIVLELQTLGKRKTPSMLAEASLYYYASILLNKYNFRKKNGSGHINYFSIVFANSGIGKDFMMNNVEKLFDLSKYPKAMMAYYENQISQLPEEPDDYGEIKRYMPKSTTIGIEGTSEGLYQVIQSQKSSCFGSLNLESREFTEHITSSSGLLSKLKEISDGYLKSKIIKGDDNTEMKSDMVNIVANFIGLGSKNGANADARKELKRIATSGLYRRTFIVDLIDIVEKNTVKDNIKKTREYLEALNDNYKKDFVERRKQDILSEKVMSTSDFYDEKLDEIDTLLIEDAQDNQLNTFKQYDTGSLSVIDNLAHIICFLEWDPEVTSKHLDKAYDFFKRSRTTVEDTFKSIHPYKLMYDLLKLKDNLTVSEMAEFEADIPIMKSKVADNVALLEELCYRKDEFLIKNEGKVTRFRIEELPVNKLDKLIFSVHNQGKGQFAINFKPVELSWEQVKKLATSEKIQSFTTSHFNPTKQAPDGHREAKSYIEGSNMIAFDVDEGMTIKEAQELFSEFTYILYTSRRHNTEEFDYRDRFRVILPTKNKFYVTSDQHKQLYINIEQFLGFKNNDIQTRNVSRLWYTNPNAEVVLENTAELLDVTFLLPSTDKSDTYIPKMNEVNDSVNEGTISNREAGYFKWFLTNTFQGNRHNHLTNAYYFFKDIGSDPIINVTKLNNMLSEPLSERDMKFIYSIGRKN